MSEVFKPLPVVHGKSLLHSLESHNYWAERKRPCPYCIDKKVNRLSCTKCSAMWDEGEHYFERKKWKD